MRQGPVTTAFALAFATALTVSGAKAADWKPTSDVEFVIPYGLGGGADLLARVIIKIMSDEKLVPVNVTAVNKPGGGASVGVAYVLSTKNANPNTLVLFNPQTQITPLTVKDARGWRDLTPVTNLMLDDYLLFVGKDSPYKNAGDLLRDAKAKPPKAEASGSRTEASTGFRAVTWNSESPSPTRRPMRALRPVTIPPNGATIRVRS